MSDENKVWQKKFTPDEPDCGTLENNFARILFAPNEKQSIEGTGWKYLTIKENA